MSRQFRICVTKGGRVRLAATLSFTTRGSKIKAKLEVELEPAAPCPNGPTPSTATTPAPGGDRHRGPAAKARASLGDAYSVEHKTCDILDAERLRLLRFDNRLIIDSLKVVFCSRVKKENIAKGTTDPRVEFYLPK